MKAQISLFTILPMDVSGEEVEDLSRHFWLVPLVGVLFGLVAGGLFFLLTMVLDGLVAATIVILVLHALNRFLHLDGLIDLGDGLVATGAREKKLAAMKDTRVGAGGVSYGILFTILIIASLSSLPAYLFLIPLAMEVVAKNSLLTVAAFGREREGLGSLFVKNTEPAAALVSLLLSAALLLPFALLSIWAGAEGVRTALVLAAMLLTSTIAGWTMSKVADRSFGCVNGDVLGATNEVGRAAAVVAALVVLACS